MAAAFRSICTRKKSLRRAGGDDAADAGGKFKPEFLQSIWRAARRRRILVVNALSEFLDLRVWRQGSEWYMRFKEGEPEAPLKAVGKASNTGTEVVFLPSRKVFTKTEFDFASVEHRLREPRLPEFRRLLWLTDARDVEPKSVEMHYEGRIEAFVGWLDQSKVALHQPPIVARTEESGIVVECAMQWNDSYHENTLCFTNNIPQKDGGTHLAGFRAALTRTINQYAETSGIAKKEKIDLAGEDMREGLTCVLSVKMPDPKFSSQTGRKAGVIRSQAGGEADAIGGMLGNWLEEHPADARRIVGKVVEAAAARRKRRARRAI